HCPYWNTSATWKISFGVSMKRWSLTAFLSHSIKRKSEANSKSVFVRRLLEMVCAGVHCVEPLGHTRTHPTRAGKTPHKRTRRRANENATSNKARSAAISKGGSITKFSNYPL